MYYIKELCIKLVIYPNYTKMHGQQNIKFIKLMFLKTLEEMKCSLICSDLAVHFVTFIPSNKYDSTQNLLHHSLYFPATYILHNRNMEEPNKGTMNGMVV